MAHDRRFKVLTQVMDTSYRYKLILDRCQMARDRKSKVLTQVMDTNYEYVIG